MKSTSINARRASLVLALCCAAAAWLPAHAEYPDHPIRVIVPAAAGGASDATVRIVTSAVTARLGQPFVIDNKPGAAGIIGLDAIAKAPADGYTIGVAALSNIVTGTLVARNLPFNPQRDFAPIAMMNTMPNLLGVAANLPIHSVKELVAYSRSHKDFFYGSNGTGSSLHVATEMFRAASGVEATHVPYKSTPAAETDLMAGQLQMMIDNLSSMLPNVQSGRIRALAITGPKRSPLLPNVPTLAEVGMPDAEMLTWVGVIGPARMPEEVVKKLNAEINAVLADPKVIRQIADLGSDAATPLSPAQFAAFIQHENARWGAVIKKGNITAE